MNENLNLVEILKDCPKGTKLYSPIYGDVELEEVYINDDKSYPIRVKIRKNTFNSFSEDGRNYREYNGECMLFPSKDNRDWSKFKINKHKFDPKTLKPFDKVLVRDSNLDIWKIQLFSRIIESVPCHPYFCINNAYTYCIHYNDDTKHLLGTSDKAPEFYRYWED